MRPLSIASALAATMAVGSCQASSNVSLKSPGREPTTTAGGLRRAAPADGRRASFRAGRSSTARGATGGVAAFEEARESHERPARLLAPERKIPDVGGAVNAHGSLLRTSHRELEAQVWMQMGQALYGDEDVQCDKLGFVSQLSSNGLILAVSTYARPGSVQVFQYDAASGWTPLGNTLTGDMLPNDGTPQSSRYLGQALSLSADGHTFAASNPAQWKNSDWSYGIVRVYHYDSTNNEWKQRGQDITGERQNRQLGHSVSLSSDGLFVAIGSRAYNDQSVARVFEYDGSSWIQRGGDIVRQGAVEVALNGDGSILAVGDVTNDNFTGRVIVYEYRNAEWQQRGGHIDGLGPQDRFPNHRSLQLSHNGLILVAGAMQQSTVSKEGYVRVFRYDSGSWSQMGDTIRGNDGDKLGWEISMSADGSIIVVGAIQDPGTYSGYGRVLQYDETNNKWIRLGGDITGEVVGDHGGRVAISGDGSTVAFSAEAHESSKTTSHGTNLNNGQVRVFRLEDLPWTLEFQETVATLATGAEEDITFVYLIGSGRSYQMSLLRKGCDTSAPVDNALYTMTNTTSFFNITHQMLNVSYSLDKAALPSSPIWNNSTSTIELCHFATLVEHIDGPLEKLFVAEHKLDVEVYVDTIANFTIKSNLTGAEILNQTDEVDAAASVDAFKCSEDFESNNDKLSPNDEMLTCVRSKDAAFEVGSVDRMTITQTSKNPLNVIVGGKIQIPSITAVDYYPGKGIIVGSRIPVNLFDFDDGKFLTIEGAVTMKLADGTSRRLNVELGSAVRNLQDDEASYTVDVALQAAEESSVQDLNSAAGVATAALNGFAIAAFFLVL